MDEQKFEQELRDNAESYERKRVSEIDRINREISDFVNSGFRSEMATFAKHWCRDHRTLQAEKFWLLIEVLKEMARMHNEGFTDARNSYECMIAAGIVAKLRAEDKIP